MMSIRVGKYLVRTINCYDMCMELDLLVHTGTAPDQVSVSVHCLFNGPPVF